MILLSRKVGGSDKFCNAVEWPLNKPSLEVMLENSSDCSQLSNSSKLKYKYIVLMSFQILFFYVMSDGYHLYICIILFMKYNLQIQTETPHKHTPTTDRNLPNDLCKYLSQLNSTNLYYQRWVNQTNLIISLLLNKNSLTLHYFLLIFVLANGEALEESVLDCYINTLISLIVQLPLL